MDTRTAQEKRQDLEAVSNLTSNGLAELRNLSRQIGRLTLRYYALKNELRTLSAGKYEGGVTVYSVRESRIRGHTRSGYTAVRVNAGKRKHLMAR